MNKRRAENNWQISKFFIFRCAGFPFELIESLKFPRTLKLMNDLSGCIKKAKFEECLKAFEEEFYEKRLELQKISSLPKFLEAIFLQDIDAYKSILNFSKQNIDKNNRASKFRSRENLIYKYLQRFCTKNETASFFGPFFIGDFSNSGTNIGLARSGGAHIRKREIFINYWFLFSIIDSIESNDKILISLKPSIPPNICFNKNSATILKTNRTLNLDKLSTEIYRLADRKKSVSEISSKLTEQGFDKDKIFERIRSMFKHSFLLSGLEIAPSIRKPEAYLLKRLVNIPSAKKSVWYKKLKKISKLKCLFQRGNLQERIAVFDEVNKSFLPQINDTYSKSRFYGRSVFSEYCSLGLKYLKIGSGIKRDLSDYLGIILSLVSYNYEKSERIRQEFIIDWLRSEFRDNPASLREVLSRATQRKGRNNSLSNIDALGSDSYLSFDSLPADAVEFLNKNRKENNDKLKIKELSTEFKKYLNYPYREMATCCDILVSAPDIGAINKGKFKLVFSESHPMRYPASCYSVLAQPSGKKKALREELAKIQKYIAGNKTLAQFLVNPNDILDAGFDSLFPAEIGYDLYPKTRKRGIDFSGLKIRHDDKSLKLLDSKNREVLLLDRLPFFDSLFSVSTPSLKCLRQAQSTAHFPKVYLGGLLFQREQWFFLKDDLFFSKKKYQKEGLRFWLELENWRRKYNIPKHVFLKSDNRVKPIYVDFENYFAIEAFIKFVKNAKKSILIEEMLPGPDGLWLKDKDGRYTCEFRLILYKKTNHPGLANNYPPGKSRQNS